MLPLTSSCSMELGGVFPRIICPVLIQTLYHAADTGTGRSQPSQRTSLLLPLLLGPANRTILRGPSASWILKRQHVRFICQFQFLKPTELQSVLMPPPTVCTLLICNSLDPTIYRWPEVQGFLEKESRLEMTQSDGRILPETEKVSLTSGWT